MKKISVLFFITVKRGIFGNAYNFDIDGGIRLFYFLIFSIQLCKQKAYVDQKNEYKTPYCISTIERKNHR